MAPTERARTGFGPISPRVALALAGGEVLAMIAAHSHVIERAVGDPTEPPIIPERSDAGPAVAGSGTGDRPVDWEAR